MRITGRLLRPSNLAERRVLKTLGVDFLRVPRHRNPFIIARHVRKLASGRGGDLPALKLLLSKTTPPPVPELPDSTSESRESNAA